MLDTDAKIQGLKGRIEQLESRITRIERMPMQGGRELGIGRTDCYEYLQEFIENAVMTIYT